MDQNRVENQVDEGTLQIHLTNASTGIPVKGAKISISYTGGPQQVLEEVDTDDSGNTEKITLDAPPLEYSMEPGENQPYAEYTIKVHATGYRDITVSAINILSGEDATQEVVMEAQDAPGNPIDTIVIDAHTLYGEYPPKIPESEIKTVEETGEIVLSRVVIPEYVVVHDGAPGDSTAANYYVRYRDYIKNVASSEIYATWPDAAIRANVLAIMSFTLNRVYTEWYRVATMRATLKIRSRSFTEEPPNFCTINAISCHSPLFAPSVCEGYTGRKRSCTSGPVYHSTVAPVLSASSRSSVNASHPSRPSSSSRPFSSLV